MGMNGARLDPVDTGPGVTRQSMREECDINMILKRYQKSGMMAHVNAHTPEYLDVSDVGDYRTAVERVERTALFFAGLPAKVRTRFGNDPAAFLDFMTDPGSEAEAIELGLVPKRKEEPPVVPAPAPVVP